MKTAIIRGLFLFGAGAGCATVVAQVYYPPPPITVGEWQARANKALIELSDLGLYVAYFEEGRVAVNLIACPPEPRPKMPANAVDQRLLDRSLGAMYSLNIGNSAAQKEPVFAVDKCKPYNNK